MTKDELIDQTRKNMKKLHVYKPEFEYAIARYADLSAEYDSLYKSWQADGCQTTVVTGANDVVRKNPQYTIIQETRKELLNVELSLGLNPKGLKAIQSKGLQEKKISKLDEVLSK